MLGMMRFVDQRDPGERMRIAEEFYKDDAQCPNVVCSRIVRLTPACQLSPSHVSEGNLTTTFSGLL